MSEKIIINGTVIKGAGEAGVIGFPTINIEPEKISGEIAAGIYAARALIEGETFNGVFYYGHRFHDPKETIFEVHLLSPVNKNYHGEKISVELVQRIRGEKKFEHEEDLKRQISDDVRKAQEILA